MSKLCFLSTFTRLTLAITVASVSVTTIFSQDLKLINGNWFNGQGFSKQTVWVSNGKFSFKSKKAGPQKVINLSGKYIVPPYGEAHNHNLESAFELDKRIAKYFLHGVFYVKLQSSIKKRIAPLMGNYNHPAGLDVSMAHAPLTGTDGHPIGIRKWYLEQGYFAETCSKPSKRSKLTAISPSTTESQLFRKMGKSVLSTSNPNSSR